MLRGSLSVAIVVLLGAFYKFYKPSASPVGLTMRTPVYFLSHGGPTFLYRDSKYGGDSGAFDATRKIGKYIRETLKPKFIVIVSAHWQSGSSSAIQVAASQKSAENELIYDFYGFPKHMYDEKFRSRNDLSLASRITQDLNSYFSSEGSSLVHASLATRGIDHGVWVPLKVALPSDPNAADDWNVDCPLVQVSLTADDADFDTHYKLGQALSRYRDEGGLVLVSGMSVHNLGDIGTYFADRSPQSYTALFTKMLRDILLTDSSGSSKLSQFKDLQRNTNKRKVLRLAHPTLEHFVPLIVGLGAAVGDQEDTNVKVTEIYNHEQGPLGWGIYQFGDA